MAKKKAHLFKPGQSGNLKGKPPGTKNKVTADIKAMVREALEKEGGVEYLREQARANPKAFLTLVTKLMPAEANLTIKTDPELVNILNARRDALAAKREKIMELIEHEPAAE